MQQLLTVKAIAVRLGCGRGCNWLGLSFRIMSCQRMHAHLCVSVSVISRQVYAFKDVARLGRTADLVQTVQFDHSCPMMGASLHKHHGESLLQAAAIEEIEKSSAEHLIAPHDRNSKLQTLEEFLLRHANCDSEAEENLQSPKRRKTNATDDLLSGAAALLPSAGAPSTDQSHHPRRGVAEEVRDDESGDDDDRSVRSVEVLFCNFPFWIPTQQPRAHQLMLSIRGCELQFVVISVCGAPHVAFAC